MTPSAWCGTLLVWEGLLIQCLDCCHDDLHAQGLLLQQREAQGEGAQLAEAWAAAAAAEADRDRARAQLARCSAKNVLFAAQASGIHNIEGSTLTTVVL